MTTYNTGNPVPSADARDRYDNSQTLDEVVNGDSESYTSRTGKQVISLGGMNSRFNNAQEGRAQEFTDSQAERESEFNTDQSERDTAFQEFLEGTGWSSIGAYGAGVVITSHTQTVDYLGQPYQLKPSIPASLDAPYVTTGAWATEGVNFKLVGDNSLRQDLALPSGGSVLGAERSTLTSSFKGGENANEWFSMQRVSIWEFVDKVITRPVANNPDTWHWSPALNAALAVNGAVVINGRHTYRLKDIRLYDGCDIEIDKSATIVPEGDGVQIFYCDDDVPSARNFTVRGGRVMNPDLVSGVTVWNCPQARRNVKFAQIYINGGGRQYGWLGVYWSKLNWLTKMQDVEVEACGTGFKFRNAAAVMHAIECVALNNGIGFDLAHLPGEADILNRIKVSGGVCQNNGIGVLTRTTDGTILDGMHFENNGTDIDSDGDKNIMLFAPEFRGNNSEFTDSIGIKFRNTIGATILKPIFAGTRQRGFMDIDASNYLVNLDIDFRTDAPLMNDSMMTNIGNVSGVRYLPNLANYRVLGGLVVDCNAPITTYQKGVPDGGAVITASNAVDGREILITLRPAGSYSSGAIRVFGTTVDVSTGTAIRAKNKTLHLIYRAAANGWVVISESQWS